ASRGQTLVKQDQPNQQNETANRKINRNFPGRPDAVAGSPNSDEEKRRDQRELVKRVKEKEINRGEGADCAGGNQKEKGVKRVLVVINLIGEPNRRGGNERGEQEHEQAQAIHAERKMNSPISRDNERADELESGGRSIKLDEESERDDQIQNRCD